MALAAEQLLSFADYLALEAQSLEKHEFFDGRMLAMSGGSRHHAHLGLRMCDLLGAALNDKPCVAFSSDLRVRVLATGLATYPDVTVVCGPQETDPEHRETVTNPTVIVEVLSPSTQAYDRGEKFDHYIQVASLRDYVLVSTGRDRIEHRSRNEDGSWNLRFLEPGDALILTGIEARIPVEQVYAKVGLVRENPA